MSAASAPGVTGIHMTVPGAEDTVYGEQLVLGFVDDGSTDLALSAIEC